MITSLGVGSGLDLQSLVNQLVSAERQAPLQRLAIKESGLQAEFSAFGSLRGATESLRSAIASLQTLQPGKAATVSGALGALTATASDQAALGSYSITIDQLATSHSLAASPFAATTDIVGSGTLTIAFGTTDYNAQTDTYNSFTANPNRNSVNIEIGPAAQTLAEVRDLINQANAGVSAVIVSDVGGERLLLSSEFSGADNSLEITVADDDGNHIDASGLSVLAFNSAATQLDQTVAAGDAELTVNGLDITSESNDNITAVGGLTLNLLTTSADPAVVQVANRTSAVRGALGDFVTAYNSFVDLVAELAKFDPETGQTGTLFGDATLRSLVQNLRTNLGTSLAGVPGEFSSLIELGLSTDEGNRLSIDSARLNTALADNFQATTDLVNEVGQSYLDVVDRYLSPDGLLQVRSDGIQARLETISEQRVDLDRRTARLQERLTQRFANLDTLLSSLQNTSQFISNQLTVLDSRRR